MSRYPTASLRMAFSAAPRCSSSPSKNGNPPNWLCPRLEPGAGIHPSRPYRVHALRGRTTMNRRTVLLAAAGLSFFGSVNSQSRVPIADAHNHLGLLRKNEASAATLGALMRESGVSLLSWTIVPDGPFLRVSSRGIEQARAIGKGELKASFDRQMSTAIRYLSLRPGPATRPTCALCSKPGWRSPNRTTCS